MCKNEIKGSVTNYQDFSFLDAESLDSGMSLTNTTDVRHTDPEFKVFYRMSFATEAIRAQIHSEEIFGLFVIGCWAVSFQVIDQSKD